MTKQITEMSLWEYIIFIGKTLISFILMLFKKPIKAMKNSKHLFALGHVVIILALLIPSRRI